MKNNIAFLLFCTFLLFNSGNMNAQEKYNFNYTWLMQLGDSTNAEQINYNDSHWQKISLPHAFNEDEAFKVSIEQLTDTVVWYRKHFQIPVQSRNKKILIEFEGVRQAGTFYLNGHLLGLHENGVMAVGFDLTPYIRYGQENILAVRVDNNWDYKEKSSQSKYQWNNRNFNANYGGIPKNVWLYIKPLIYQTLPLYSQLGTTGTYIYADQFDITRHKAVVHATSQVKNETGQVQKVIYQVCLFDKDGRTVKTFNAPITAISPGTTILSTSALISGLHFWSWGYGYLYTVKTRLLVKIGRAHV